MMLSTGIPRNAPSDSIFLNILTLVLPFQSKRTLISSQMLHMRLRAKTEKIYSAVFLRFNFFLECDFQIATLLCLKAPRDSYALHHFPKLYIHKDVN